MDLLPLKLPQLYRIHSLEVHYYVLDTLHYPDDLCI